MYLSSDHILKNKAELIAPRLTLLLHQKSLIKRSQERLSNDTQRSGRVCHMSLRCSLLLRSGEVFKRSSSENAG